MEIYYINSAGERLDLDEWPIAVTDLTQLFGRKWDVVGDENITRRRSRLKYVTRTSREYSIDVSIYADTLAEFCEIMNRLEDITDYDARMEAPGRLYVGEFYLECFIADTAPKDFEELFETVDTQLTVRSLQPHWTRDYVYVFKGEASSYQPETYEPITSGGIYPGAELDAYYIRTDYPYDYKRPDDYAVSYPERDFPYDYYPPVVYETITNPMQSSADFEIVIYGYAVNPSVVIGDNTYTVMTTVQEGERLIINAREMTVVKVDSRGNETNAFYSREKAASIFEPLPSGELAVNWAATYDLQITVYDERSEPEWSF